MLVSGWGLGKWSSVPPYDVFCGSGRNYFRLNTVNLQMVDWLAFCVGDVTVWQYKQYSSFIRTLLQLSRLKHFSAEMKKPFWLQFLLCVFCQVFFLVALQVVFWLGVLVQWWHHLLHQLSYFLLSYVSTEIDDFAGMQSCYRTKPFKLT